MSDGRAERLARQIRSACGRYNDDDEPVVLCVAQMRERISELEAKLAAAEADIQRLVSEAVEREALFQAERERVRVLRDNGNIKWSLDFDDMVISFAADAAITEADAAGLDAAIDAARGAK